MEKTFEELMHNKFDALEHYGGFKLSTKQQNAILELLQQVREATGNEFLKAMEGVDLPIVTTMKITAIMATNDRIKITE